ncbi:hypothetical protein CIK99_13845 [Prevotella sp. P5-92]|uniref:hypothetical protein n=1 Tax=Prevotella sp. P5-92 TaxID=2024222 RepID=UPI000B96FBE5|nr:hypothetical protein [Prevotella sp. P5-92]OYP54305.1 hypothetical protein CIK99_13845 [Prevotella sp. P5-92]
MSVDLKSELVNRENYYLELEKKSRPDDDPAYNNILSTYREIQEILDDDSEYGRKLLVRVQEKLECKIYDYKNCIEWVLRYWTVIVPFSKCVHHISHYSSFYASSRNMLNEIDDLYIQAFDVLLEEKGIDYLKEVLEGKLCEIIEKDDNVDARFLKEYVDKLYSYWTDYASLVNFDGDISDIQEIVTNMIRFASYNYYKFFYTRYTEKEREIIEQIFQDDLINDLVVEEKYKINTGFANLLSEKYRYSYPKVDFYLSANGIDIENMIVSCREKGWEPDSLAYFICEKVKVHKMEFHLNDTAKPPKGFIRELMDLTDKFVKEDYCSENNFSKKFNAWFEELGLK